MIRKILRTVLILVVALPVVSQDAPPVDTQVWSMERLDLDITIDPEEKTIAASGTMTVRLEDETSSGPAFALNSRVMAMRFRRLEAEGTGALITRYKPNLPVEAAILRLPRVFTRGDTLEVSFLVESEMESSQLRVGADAVFASWVEMWYPLPATIEKGSASPAAPGTTTFRLPAGWRSVSNGVLESSIVRGDSRIERWVTDVPAARSFVAGPFEAVESVESHSRTISFYLLRPRTSAEEQATALARSLEAMEARFGPYPYPTYHVAEIPEDASFAAASEQGFIMVRSSVLDEVSASLPLFAHEAGHGWWGNLVRPDGPGGKLLGEALAQYGAVISIEAIEGADARNRFLRFSRPGYSPLQCALGYFFIWREGGDKPLAQLDEDQWDHNLADSKGMWFHHMLRARVGDDVYFTTLRSIIRDFAGQRATLGDLRSRFLDSSDDPSLSHFFEQWLDRAGAPVIDLDWWSINRGRGIEIHIGQLQQGAPFSFPLELAIDLDDGTTIRRVVELSEGSHQFELETTSRPLDVHIDPDHRLLLWRPEYGPRPGVEKDER